MSRPYRKPSPNLQRQIAQVRGRTQSAVAEALREIAIEKEERKERVSDSKHI